MEKQFNLKYLANILKLLKSNVSVYDLINKHNYDSDAVVFCFKILGGVNYAR